MIKSDRNSVSFKAAFLGVFSLLTACSPPPIPQPSANNGYSDDSWEKAVAASCNGLPEGAQSWAAAAPPTHIHGQTYYVGTCGITALLITSDEGHILLDGGPEEAAPLILANIGELGFKPGDIRWIVSSHEHWDHVGSFAGLKRLTGAKVAALPAAAEVLRSGKPHPDDPQHAIAEPITPVKVDRVLANGEVLELDNIRLTVHATPAHAPGSTSWTWQSCSGSDCKTIAYADSATIISDDAYRFSDNPNRVSEAREGLARISALPCDILITPHPGASNLFQRIVGNADLIDAQACRTYSKVAESRFAVRLAKETVEAPKQ